MKPYVFVVYDEKNRVIDVYANKTWANKKAARSENYRVESYVHTKNRKAIEMEEFVTRPENDGGTWRVGEI